MNLLIQKINNLLATTRVLLALGIATGVFLGAISWGSGLLTGIAMAWDVFALLVVILSAITFFTLPQESLRRQAQLQDERRTTTFILVLFSICISLGGIVALLRHAGGPPAHPGLQYAVSLLGVALSWLLLHTVFTLRYAHLYYWEAQGDRTPGGLDFPENDPQPAYPDFAYFAFVIGMTFQVSDITITSPRIRKVVLLHSLLSFVFNTLIVALTVSILSGLGH